MRELTPRDELGFLEEIHASPHHHAVVRELRDAFHVLQVRSQLLLGLVSICLTITGFSGHRIVQAGWPARVAVFVGVFSVLASALLLVMGPLRIRWMSHYREADLDATLVRLIERRNHRTRLYHAATVLLIGGLGGYVLSLGFYLLSHGALD